MDMLMQWCTWKVGLAAVGGGIVWTGCFLKFLQHQMREARYQRTTLLLQLEVDYSKAPHVLKSDQATLDQAAEDIVSKLGKFKKGDLKVVRREVTDAEMDPDAIYSRPAPPEFPVKRTVIEMFFAPTSNKIIARMCTHLKCYDGVVCVGAALNVLEILEGKDPTPAAIGVPNPKYSFNLTALSSYFKQFGRLWLSLFCSLPRFFKDKEYLPPNLLSLGRGKGPREWYNWCEPALSFKACCKLASQIVDQTGLTHVCYTNNYAHQQPTGTCSVAMGVMPNQMYWKNSSNKEVKQAHIFTPIAFGDIDEAFASITSNAIFWNNYGKHDNDITGTVTGFRWFVPGTPDCFVPIMTVLSIKGKVHLLMSMPLQYQEQCQDLVATLGKPGHKMGVPDDFEAFFAKSPELVPGL